MILSTKDKLTIVGLKLISKLIKIIKAGNAEALPGHIAEKIDSSIFFRLLELLPKKIVIIGTNGKTTTANLIYNILKDNNILVFGNRNGSNLRRGILSLLIKSINSNFKYDYDYVILEIDEAVFNKYAKQIKPDYIIITNLFRDQLDRYFEVNGVLKAWSEIINPLETTVFLNANDPIVSSLDPRNSKLENTKTPINAKFVYYSLSTQIENNERAKDTTTCTCLNPLTYKKTYYSHLGEYACSKCGRNYAEFIDFSIDYDRNVISYRNKYINVNPTLNGMYNYFNVIAAFSLACSLNLDPKKIVDSIDRYKTSYGRFEQIKYKNKNIYLVLVKNPSGANQVISEINKIESDFDLLFGLNDKIADGQDVSWIWDIEVEKINKDNLKSVNTFAERAYDIALRFKYADYTLKSVNVDYLPTLTSLLENSNDLYIVASYTALMNIYKYFDRKKLTNKYE